MATFHQMTIYKRKRMGLTFDLEVLKNEALEDPETNVIRVWKRMLFYRQKNSEIKHKITENGNCLNTLAEIVRGS